MSTHPQRCERAYKRGFGCVQIRTDAGRLLVSAEHVEAIEDCMTGSRVLWHRHIDHGRVVWLARTSGNC